MTLVYEDRGTADYQANALKLLTPVPDGLVGWWYLGALPGDDADAALARTIKNLAGTTHAMVPAGSPVISEGYVTLDSAHYFQTTIPETLSYSILAVFQPITAPSGIAGWFSGLTNRWHNNGSAPPRFDMINPLPHDVGGVVNLTNWGTINTNVWTTPNFITSKFDSAIERGTIRNLTANRTVTGTITGTRVLVTPATTLRIGGDASSPNESRMSFLAVYDRCISDGEGDTIRAFVAAYMLRKFGVVV